MNPNLLRVINLEICLVGLIPIVLLIINLYKERKFVKVKEKLRLNTILMLIVGVIGLRLLVQIILWVMILSNIFIDTNILNTNAILTNGLSTMAAWLFYLYVKQIKKS